MNLFLTSSGVTQELQHNFLTFLKKEPLDVQLFFIPNASDVEENKFYVCKSLEEFAAMGMNPIWYSLQNKTASTIENELSRADVIWVGGGDTAYLMNLLKKTGADVVIKKLVENQGIVFGGTSAGAIAATLPSLGFIDGSMHVHVSSADDKHMSRNEKNIYLRDGEAIQVRENSVVYLP